MGDIETRAPTHVPRETAAAAAVPDTDERGGRHTRRATVEVSPTSVAAAVVAIHALAVAYLVVPGGLYIDDFRAQAYAVGRGIWPFIVESNATHLSPGARTVDWLQATYAPLEHWPAVLYTLLVAAALGLVLWRLLRQLVSSEWVALVGLVLGLFAPSVVPALAWYRQALTTMTALVLILAALDAGLRYLRGGPARWAAAATLFVAVGLCFSERVLVTAVALAVAGLLLGTAPTLGRRLRRTLVLLAPMSVVNLVFLYFYGSGDFDHASEGTPTISGFLLSTGRSLFVNVVPGLLGGPLVWRRSGVSYAFAATPLWLAVLAGLAVVGIVIAVWLRRRVWTGRQSPLRVLLVAVSYILPVYGLLYVGRVSRAQVDSVDDLRLYPDVAVFVAVVVAAALDAGWRAPRSKAGRRLVAMSAVAVVVATAASWVGFAVQWHRSTSSEFVSALRTDLAGNKAPVIPTPVPDTIVPGWVQPDFSTASLVKLLAPHTQLTVMDASPKLVSRTGNLVPARFDTIASAKNARSDFCGNGLVAGEDELVVDFADAVPYYRGSLVQLRLLVSDSTRVDVRVTGSDGTSHTVVAPSQTTMLRGPHMMVVPVPHNVRVTSVTITRSRPTAGLCVTGVSVVSPAEVR